MWKLKLDISPSRLLIIFGMILLVAILMSSMNLIFKSIGLMISIIIILFGALVETPLLERYGDRPPEKMKDEKAYPFQK